MNKFLILKDNFLIKRECDFLIKLHNANINNTIKHPTGPGKDQLTNVLKLQKGLDDKIDELINKKENFVKQHINDVKIVNIEIVEWLPGVELKPHYDITPDNTHYKAATVCYLNKDYEGGDTVIENNTIISPEVGRLIVFDGLNYKHGVKQISKNKRYTFISWFM